MIPGPMLAALGASYLLGSLPTAYLVVRRLKRVDVRTVGSGNAGATNVARVAGRGAGAVVFVIDVAKGAVATGAVVPWLVQPAAPSFALACGLMAVIGHVAPVWLGFRGGKGVATAIGALAGCAPVSAAWFLAVWAAVFLRSRIVSVASLLAALTVPAGLWAAGKDAPSILVGASLALLIIATHRANLARLRQGGEPRWRPGAGRQGREEH